MYRILFYAFLIFCSIACQSKSSTKNVNKQLSKKSKSVTLIDTLPIRKAANKSDGIFDEPIGSVTNKIIGGREYFYERARFRHNAPSGKWYIYERPKGIHTYRYSDESMEKDIKAFKVEVYDNQDQLLKTIDLERTNPYANKENPKYIGEGRPGFEERAYGALVDDSIEDLVKLSNEYYSIAEIWESSEDYFIIDYGMVARDSRHRYIGEEHTWIILDNKGGELGKVDGLRGWVRDGVLSKDKKFLFFLIGDAQSLEKQRLKIFSLDESKIIYDSNHLKESYTTLTDMKFEGDDQQWISIGVENPLRNNVVRTKKYINVSSKEILTKEFNEKEWEQVKAYYVENKNVTPRWMINKFDFLTEKF